jgi:hypothetical protein
MENRPEGLIRNEEEEEIGENMTLKLINRVL